MRPREDRRSKFIWWGGSRAERPGSDHEMSVGGAARAKEKEALVVGTGKGFMRRCGSRERTSNHTAMVESHPRSGTVGRRVLSALTTPACTGCFRRSISADVEPRQEVIVAQLMTLSSCLSFDSVWAVYLAFAAPLSMLLSGKYETGEVLEL